MSSRALWQHQIDACDFAGERSAAMLAMPMGVGKSACIVEVVARRRWRRILILAPKSVVSHWPREFARGGSDAVVIALDGRKPVAARVAQARAACAAHEAHATRPLVIVTNHESAWRGEMSDWIAAWNPELLVVDESHRAKDPFGRFSKWLAAAGRTARQRIALTGTPFPHSPLDIFAQYRFLLPDIFGWSFTRFRARYAIMGGWQGKQVVGYRATDELAERFRRIAYECPADAVSLPETVDSEIRVELSAKARRVYNQVAEDFWSAVGGGSVTASNALTRLLRLQQITGGSLPLDVEEGEDPRARRVEEVDAAKTDALTELLGDLPHGEPVVVFARFRADLDRIHVAACEAGLSSAELSGRVDDLEAWQGGEADVLAVQIQAGGVGVDLTRARVCVYYSLGFSLGEYLQSRKRVHRPGQTRSVLYTHLIASGTVDEQVYQALERRQDVIEAVLSGETGTSMSSTASSRTSQTLPRRTPASRPVLR